jgi:hypothetical protein
MVIRALLPEQMIEQEKLDALSRDGASMKQVAGDHYVKKSIQPWDAMCSWMSPEQFKGFLRGNAIKYLARAYDKGSTVDDLMKASHYIEKLIEEEKKA